MTSRFTDAYGRGFERGEREAFMDRAWRVKRDPPAWMISNAEMFGRREELRGWRDGYTPRNLDWATGKQTMSQLQSQWVSGHAIIPEWPVRGGAQRVVFAGQAEALLASRDAEIMRLRGAIIDAIEEMSACGFRGHELLIASLRAALKTQPSDPALGMDAAIDAAMQGKS
jgi:hypothetical protein